MKKLAAVSESEEPAAIFARRLCLKRISVYSCVNCDLMLKLYRRCGHRRCGWFARYQTWVYISETEHGVVEVYHAGINDDVDLQWAMDHILSTLDSMSTPYLNQETDQNKENKLMVAKWLCDLHEKVNQDFVAGRTIAAKNLLSKRWLVTRGMGTELFTLKKDVGVGRCCWETLTMPFIVPRFILCSLLNCEKAKAQAELSIKYTAVAHVFEAEQRIHLESRYSVRDVASVVASCTQMGKSVAGIVRVAAALGAFPSMWWWSCSRKCLISEYWWARVFSCVMWYIMQLQDLAILTLGKRENFRQGATLLQSL